MSRADTYIDENMSRFREELFDFLRIPSVSANSENRPDMQRAAEWLAQRMREAGLQAAIHPTEGHPIVLGEWRGAGAGAPTVLIYGHYDVQPAEPLELWSSPPYEPEIRDGRIYARGSVDDKGQLYLHVKALESLLKAEGRLPVNVVLIAEGEEEVGSDHLVPFLEKMRDTLACDYVIVSDTTMVAPGVPTIGASLRGLAYFQIDVQGPSKDLHSGSYGGAVLNPATVLCRIIASFHDANWHATIPGFYDKVRPAEEARAQIAQVPFEDETLREETGSPTLGGEAGYSTLERLWVRPTVEVNGLLSGFTGEGSKTVLPAHAMAKVSCRLVPDQDPVQVAKLFVEHVHRVTPKEGVTVTITPMHTGHAWRAQLGGKLYEAAARSLEAAFGREVVYAGEGGSIPIVSDFERVLGAPVLLIGFGLPGENAHAPDEWLDVDTFERGMHAAANLLAQLSA
jgi:acetylornithine deacetylase/succinyl-diaminopimelate desuccinylase-like protein